MKILFVLPNFGGGGAERVALTLLAHLDRNQFEPHLAVFEEQGPLQSLVAEDVRLHVVGGKRLRKALFSLVKLVWQQHPAAVFSTHRYINLALLMVKAAMPAGTGIVVREPLTPSQSIANEAHPRLIAWAYHHLYRRADLVLCQHRQTEQELQGYWDVPASIIAGLPNPVPLAMIRRQAATPLRRPGPGARFVAAGRLRGQKGFDQLIRLFPQMSEASHLTIYGEGEELGRLSSLIAELALGSRVLLAGFTDNLPAALAGADACLISSRWEGLPNVALESLACGTPVIATPESGGISELAEAACPGAVTIARLSASDPTGFLHAMQSSQPKDGSTLADSLLPPHYEVDAVIGRFNSCLSQLVRRPKNR